MCIMTMHKSVKTVHYELDNGGCIPFHRAVQFPVRLTCPMRWKSSGSSRLKALFFPPGRYIEPKASDVYIIFVHLYILIV
jgi:hypothetical protein